jgi:lactose/L-arabinose transport system permease protein
MASGQTHENSTTGKVRAFVVSFANRWARATGYNVLAILGAILFAFPFYFMVVGSTLPSNQFLQFPPQLLPGGQFVENYTKSLLETNFLRALLNSLIYAIFSTIGVLVLATCAGYAFAKFAFPGHDALFYSTLVTLAIPFQLIAIPLFKLLTDFGLVDSFPGLILPAIAHPIGVFFMKQNIEQTIIDDMLNSARIDGASESQIFLKIVLPLVRPGLAALAVLMFLLRMNGLFWPLVVMRSEQNQVATVFLAKLHGGPQAPTAWETMLPAAVVATLPVLLVFIFLQKHFVKGLLAGTTKE